MHGAIRRPDRLSRMRSFFDPSLIERHGAAFIREGEVDKALARLIPKAHITKGHYSYPARAELRDLVWNHMDQNHDPSPSHLWRCDARAYRRAGGFSLTRFGNWPLVVPVFDGYYKDNGFYQVICLFGLVVIVQLHRGPLDR